MPPARIARAYLEEMRSECLRYVRHPGFILPVVLFPAMFYLLFAVVMGSVNGPGAARYLLGSFSVFGVMSPGLFGFGVSLAMERDNGLLTLKRALPMPPAAYLIGKMVMAMAAAVLVVVELLVLATLLTPVTLGATEVLALFVTGMLGVLPFCALGMWVGSIFKGQAAPGMLQAVYLPMAFLSGLWIPLPILPSILGRIAPIWPSWHLNAIALDVVGVQATAWWPHVIVLAGFAALFLGLAVRRLERRG
jgi:ABC-2 type transport system permease protein